MRIDRSIEFLESFDALYHWDSLSDAVQIPINDLIISVKHQLLKNIKLISIGLAIPCPCVSDKNARYLISVKYDFTSHPSPNNQFLY